MKNGLSSIASFLLDLLFPIFCLNCGREGRELCQDCQGLLSVVEYRFCLCSKPSRVLSDGKCHKCRLRALNGLYAALSYEDFLTQKLLRSFKYPPYLKSLTGILASFIIAHFQMLDKPPDFSGFYLVPVPLHRKKIKERGFNQSEELAKELGKVLGLEKLSRCLVRIKETHPQVELKGRAREENVKGAFLCLLPEQIQGRKILLVDDVYTTGATMNECAAALKKVGAREVWGVVVARG